MKVPAILALALMSVFSVNAFANDELKEENTTAVVVTQDIQVAEDEAKQEVAQSEEEVAAEDTTAEDTTAL